MFIVRIAVLLALVFFALLPPASAEESGDAVPPAEAQFGSMDPSGRELSETGVFWRVLTLREYNTRLVVFCTSILGLASGLIGTFLLLRKRSLMGDALSHACLPGIGIAFLLAAATGGEGRNLIWLLAGAMATGLLGVLMVLAVRGTSRIKDDAAMGIVLSVFFGGGVAVLGMVQSMPGASAAGLESFIYGKTASMVWSDFLLLSGVASAAVVASLLLRKEFMILCFDEGFARSQGWPVGRLDVVMLGLVAVVTVAGLQAVGLILIIAFLIIPAAAARFWTNRLSTMLLLAAGIGAVSGWTGSSASALLSGLPAGAVIVLAAAALFVASLFFGTARGVLRRGIERRRLNRRIARQHLLRGAYEILEARAAGGEDEGAPENRPIPIRELQSGRSWSPRRFRTAVRRAGRDGYVECFDGDSLRLSEAGYGEAVRMTRNHRLWETFLITHADIAASHVDRDADAVEHVLGADLVAELERKLGTRALVASPHPLHSKGGRA